MTMTPKIKAVCSDYGTYWVVMFVSFDGAKRVVVTWKRISWQAAISSLRSAYYWGQVLNHPEHRVSPPAKGATP
jgi:hypothetical protein